MFVPRDLLSALVIRVLSLMMVKIDVYLLSVEVSELCQGGVCVHKVKIALTEQLRFIRIEVMFWCYSVYPYNTKKVCRVHSIPAKWLSFIRSRMVVCFDFCGLHNTNPDIKSTKHAIPLFDLDVEILAA